MENAGFTPGTYTLAAAEIIGIIIIVALIWAVWRKKTKEPFFPAFIGACVWFVFALVLETIPKALVVMQPAASRSLVLTGIISSAFAGVFEETGRFIAFKTVLSKYRTKRTAVTYAIGHGGFEAVFLITLTLLSTLFTGYMLGSGKLDASLAMMSQEQQDMVYEKVAALADLKITDVLTAYLERIIAMIIHLSLSVPVFLAAREKRSFMLYPLAVILHFVLDAVYAYFSFSGICPLIVTEIITLAAVVPVAVFAYRLYRSRPDEVSE